MAEEEFQESEVIFEQVVEEEDGSVCNFAVNTGESRNNKGKRKKLKVNKESSAPMSIPENVTRRTWFSYVDLDDFDGCNGEMVPPHVIIGRRVAGKMMAFSLCSGNGRTLKGRDLSEVRNSILRMTGFLET